MITRVYAEMSVPPGKGIGLGIPTWTERGPVGIICAWGQGLHESDIVCRIVNHRMKSEG